MLSNAAEKILLGNWLFVACCIVYLVWWNVAFKPGFIAPMAAKTALFSVTAFLGIAGLLMIVRGCSETKATDMSFPTLNMIIIGAGILLYIVLLLLTNALMHRQITTELMLIVFWLCMELCTCTSLYYYGVLTRALLIILAIAVIVSAAIGMICYLAYYNMPPMKAFYDGMVPLILFAVIGSVISICQMIRM